MGHCNSFKFPVHSNSQLKMHYSMPLNMKQTRLEEVHQPEQAPVPEDVTYMQSPMTKQDFHIFNSICISIAFSMCICYPCCFLLLFLLGTCLKVPLFPSAST